MVKKMLVLALGAAISLGALSATKISHTNQSLNQQVRALQTQVKKLQAQVSDLQDYNSCDSVVVVRRFGDSTTAGKFGYLYANPDNTGGLTTALDYPDQGSAFDSTSDAWFTVVDPSCVKPSSRVVAAHKVGHPR